MLNRLQIIGNAGAAPEVRDVNGVKVANLNIGVTERGYKTSSGKDIPDRTDWFTVVAWRGLAEILQKYVGKGDKLYIDGKMKSRQYEKDGQKRTVWELYAENIVLLSPKRDGHTGQADSTPPPVPQEGNEDPDDLPF